MRTADFSGAVWLLSTDIRSKSRLEVANANKEWVIVFSIQAVPEVHASAYQAASPCRGTGQLPAVPSSHTTDLHPGRVSPDIRVTEDEGDNWLGWVQLCSSRNGEEDS
ncbi:hypothetical protein EYF80_016462 [Liparis tanakae]|uniref:Uncharacterized protein n=1 Tax=Liparis tanakae TaxID=230148 RepID=A0A4Z2I5G8_9TELE|nr:hypothetical protein EYF80_016462 [Liparis tanakae]